MEAHVFTTQWFGKKVLWGVFRRILFINILITWLRWKWFLYANRSWKGPPLRKVFMAHLKRRCRIIWCTLIDHLRNRGHGMRSSLSRLPIRRSCFWWKMEHLLVKTTSVLFQTAENSKDFAMKNSPNKVVFTSPYWQKHIICFILSNDNQTLLLSFLFSFVW